MKSARTIAVTLLAFALVASLGGCAGMDDPPEKVQTAAEDYFRNERERYTVARQPVERLSIREATSPRIALRDSLAVPEIASSALGRIGVAAVPDVIGLLRDPDSMVRSRGAEILARIGPDAKAAVPDLTALLEDEHESVRRAAAYALGQIGPDAAEAVPALLKAATQE